MNGRMIEYLFEALVADIGIVVECDQPEKLIRKLQKTRLDNISKFKELKIVLSPTSPKNEVWIMKEKQNAES